MEKALYINERLEIPGDELHYVASRSGGPGGQHVNKTSSRVSLKWNIVESSALDDPMRNLLLRRLGRKISSEGILQIHVDENRSQHRNLEIARERLAQLLRDALVEKKKRVPTKVSAGARRRRLKEKKQRAKSKELRRNPPRDDY